MASPRRMLVVMLAAGAATPAAAEADVIGFTETPRWTKLKGNRLDDFTRKSGKRQVRSQPLELDGSSSVMQARISICVDRSYGLPDSCSKPRVENIAY